MNFFVFFSAQFIEKNQLDILFLAPILFQRAS